MGLDINAVWFLIAARKGGVDFGEVLTLGRLLEPLMPRPGHWLLIEAKKPGACETDK